MNNRKRFFFFGARLRYSEAAAVKRYGNGAVCLKVLWSMKGLDVFWHRGSDGVLKKRQVWKGYMKYKEARGWA